MGRGQDVMEDALIQQMREDYRTVADWLVKFDGWTEADVEEMGESIRRRIEAKDEDMLESWSTWLAKRSKEIREEKSC